MGNSHPSFLDGYEDLVRKNLIFNYNSISDPNEKKIIEYHYLNEIMKYNYLFANCSIVFFEISHDEIVFLSKALRTNTSLVKLDLSQIKLKDEELIYLINNGLSHLSNIQHLNFSHNMLTCKGIECLANFMCYNSKITKLDLSTNRIATNGMISLSAMVMLNRTIRHLNLFNNKQTKEDNAYFYDRLIQNYSILYFRNTFYSSKEIAYIKKIIERNIAFYQGAFYDSSITIL